MTEQPVPEFGLKTQTADELFADIVGQSWTAEEQQRLRTAYELAAELHAGDDHRDQPYVYHLLRVADRLVSYLDVRDAELVTAALLHDSVEDHADGIIATLTPDAPVPDDPRAQQQAALAIYARLFSAGTASIVAAVTNPPDLFAAESYEAGLDNYRQKVRKAVQTPAGALLKFSDWCDNAVGIIHSNFAADSPRKRHFQNKYGGELIDVFAERFAQADLQSQLSPSSLAYVQQQLALAASRLNRD